VSVTGGPIVENDESDDRHDPEEPEGDGAREQFARVYDELRRLAAAALRHERLDHTLEPTALVHEAYLRLADLPGGAWKNRAHFLALAARAMRRILVDHARSRGALKRGSGGVSAFEDLRSSIVDPTPNVDVLLLDTALSRLAALDKRQARIVELRFFGGLSVEETASVIGSSPRTVKRDWQLARAWLRREMSKLADGD
jgi:RNA polymerase sigma factor (TIGR02999 family)